MIQTSGGSAFKMPIFRLEIRWWRDRFCWYVAISIKNTLGGIMRFATFCHGALTQNHVLVGVLWRIGEKLF